MIDIGIKYERFAKNRFINRGLLSIATFLKAKGYNINYISLNQFYLQDISNYYDVWKILENNISINNYQIIAVSNILIPETKIALKLLKKVKSTFPDIITIIGGYYFTLNDEKIKRYNFIDFIIRGEGEWSLLELLDRIKKRKKVNAVRGVTYINKEGKIQKNPDQRLGRLSELPPLDYSIIDNDYLLNKNPPNINLEFNRGCYYDCTFCSVSDFWRNQVRFHRVEKLISELKQLNKLKYKGKISIEDSTLDFRTERMKRFLRESSKLKKSYRFDYITTRYDKIDPDSLELIYSLGFSDIILGLESASEKILNIINKNIDLNRFIQACRVINKKGLRVNVFIIIGLPGETKETLIHTYSFLRNLALNGLIANIFVSHFQPYTGIKALKDFDKYGGKLIIKNDDFSNWIFRGKPHVEYDHLKRQELQKMFVKINQINQINGTDFISRF